MTLAVVGILSSCSIALQPSVRSSSVECSTSFGYAATDFVFAGGFAFVASRGIGESSHGISRSSQETYVLPAEIATGVMVASALIGVYKRHNCVRWRETAPPEEWARIAQIRRQEAEANARAQAEFEREQAAAAQAQAEANARAQAEFEREQAAAAQAQTETAAQGQTEASAQQQPPPPACPPGTEWDDMFGECAAPRGIFAPGASNPAPSGPSPTITVERGQAAPPPVPGPGRNAVWHAIYSGGCQAFNNGSSELGANMVACSRFCTPHLVAKERCTCDPGVCP